MPTALSLFPARVPIGSVTPDGKVFMTPEFYRALQSVMQATTGEENTFTDVFMPPSTEQSAFAEFVQTNPQYEADFLPQTWIPANGEQCIPEVMQPQTSEQFSPEVQQPLSCDEFILEVAQPVDTRSMSPVEAVTVGASPNTYTADRDGYLTIQGGTVSKIEYVRRAAATDTGVTAGMFTILVGDGLTVTYTVAPTITFIPR